MLAAVVVTFRPPKGMLETTVRSVLDGGDVDLVVVVDNGGVAADEVAAASGGDARVELIRNASNGGFGAGANEGIRRALAAGADAVAVLNDDVRVTAGWTRPLLAELAADPRVGAVQPKLLFEPVPGSAPGVPARVNSLGVRLDDAGAGIDIGYGEPDDPSDTVARDVALVTGGAVVFRRTFLEQVGLFDACWFLYYEDVDLSLRGARAGWRFRCAPASVVWHHGSASTAALGDRTLFLQERNRLRNAARHLGVGAMWSAVWLSVRRLRHAPRPVHRKALLHGVATWPGELGRRITRR